jgi:flagellar basal body-associated protein FliL
MQENFGNESAQRQQYPEPETVGFPPQSAPNPKKSGMLKWIIIAIIGILVIGGAAFFVLSGGDNNEVPEPTSQSISFVTTPVPTALATSTPTAANKEDISIQVLNGTGVAGEAGYLKDQLNSADYADVDTANATGANVTVTTMTYNSQTSPAVVSEITQILERIYQQVETKQSSSSGAYDISVVVGLRKGATPKPAASSTPSASTSPSPSPSATP